MISSNNAGGSNKKRAQFLPSLPEWSRTSIWGRSLTTIMWGVTSGQWSPGPHNQWSYVHPLQLSTLISSLQSLRLSWFLRQQLAGLVPRDLWILIDILHLRFMRRNNANYCFTFSSCVQINWFRFSVKGRSFALFGDNSPGNVGISTIAAPLEP